MRKFVLLAAFLAGSPLFAQIVSTSRPKTYGTSRLASARVLASEFAPPVSGVGWAFDDSNGATSLYQSTPGTVRWWAPVRVPGGALVEALDLEACDFTSTGQIVAGLRRSALGAGEDLLPVRGTGTAETPGCLYFPLTLDDPLTIDNSNYDYWVFVQWEGDFSLQNRLVGIHVVYKLQVSPDPAYSTFGDVPANHPLHRFIEALAYSEITAGCGGGNYCPDAPLTRGQMAVFLSKALGLQWP